MLAAMHGKIACVEKLLEAGANVWEVSNLKISCDAFPSKIPSTCSITGMNIFYQKNFRY